MEFWKVIEKRRSVRCYTPETVAPEQLEQVLAATNLDLGSVYLLAATDAIKQSPELVKALNLPEGFTPTASLGLGHRAEDARKGPEDANEVKSRACRIEINHVK